MKKISLIVLLLSAINLLAQSPSLKLNDLNPNSIELQKINPSKDGELTIASMNIRDLIGRERTLNNFIYLADILDEADIIVLQEVGAKGYSRSNKERMDKNADAFMALFKSYLGKDWHGVKAPNPTPESLGLGAELPMLFYKSKIGEISIKCEWKDYADLGEKRDMGVFNVKLSSGSKKLNFQLGSVHTKPDCPLRGEQLFSMVDYINSTEDPFIICGDFNWGYKSKTRCEGEYDGEQKLLDMEEEGIVHIPFGEISYMGKGDEENFRTNLMIRKSVHFYDQFVVSKYFSDKYADNCSLSEDCGFISISESKEFKKEVEGELKSQMKGAKVAASIVSKVDSCGINKDELLKEVEKAILKNWKTADAASYLISDHKPIWVQIKPFD